jgi:hypothetical protein
MQMLNGFPAKVSYRRASYKCLADLAQNPGQLAMIRAAAGHSDVVQGVITEEQAQFARSQIRAATTGKAGVRAVNPSFARGKIFRHKPSGRKVTIIRAAASQKNGEVQHEVIDGASGKKFLARESNLKPLL